MDKKGFVERYYVPKASGIGIIIEKYEHHPDLRDHLDSKYAGVLYPGANGHQHILNLGFEQAGETLFHKTFQPVKNLTLDASSRYLFTVTMKRGHAA